MARGRMLNNSVSLSLKFNQLPDDTCRLLATWIIAHLDKNGVFYGAAVSVKSVVFPHRADIAVEQVERYLQAMEQAGLIQRFAVKGVLWQWWPTFADNQVGLRADRESSDYPAPPIDHPGPDTPPPPPPPNNPPLPESWRQNGGKNPAETREPSPPLNPNKVPEGEVEVEDESKKVVEEEESRARKTETPPADPKSLQPGAGVIDPEFQKVCRTFESEIGGLSPAIRDKLVDDIKTYSADWVIRALEVASVQNVRKLSYAEGILKKWQRIGGPQNDGPLQSEAGGKTYGHSGSKPATNGAAATQREGVTNSELAELAAAIAARSR